MDSYRNIFNPNILFAIILLSKRINSSNNFNGYNCNSTQFLNNINVYERTQREQSNGIKHLRYEEIF
jgi:hypothetical protein